VTKFTEDKVSPILRWAGGKNWLVKHIEDFIPINGFKNYHEPFLGGASVFLSINTPKASFLSDLNAELIETYINVKNNVEQIIDLLKTFKNTEDFYYNIRSSKQLDHIYNSARFIYLNQTSFNGIYRVNLKGEYNVPYGYRNKNFLEPEKLRLVSKKLQNTNLDYADFDNIRENIKKKDLIFLDPPYTVSHNNNGFIKYNQKIFSLDDQKRLSSLIDFIKRKDAYFIMTNASHKIIDEIFDKGDSKIVLSRASLIGGIKAKRGQVTEYIFSNTKI